MRLPIKITRHEGSFGITDVIGTTICYVYFDTGSDSERGIRKLMSEAEAEAIVKGIARHLTNEKDPPPPEGSGEP